MMNTRRTAGSTLLATASRQNINTTELFTNGDYNAEFNMETIHQCTQYTSAQVSELCFEDKLQPPWARKLSAIALTASHISVDPRSRSQAMVGPFAEQWFEAEQAELQSLIDCDAFELVTPPQAAMVLNGTWVYATKFKDGVIAHFKARFVADGRNQIVNTDTYAPVADITVLRLLLAVAVQRGAGLKHADVSTAFLQSPITEAVYVRQPQGHVKTGDDGKYKVMRSKRSLYGLKTWYDTMDQYLKHLVS
jgi:Reverse transcriptase (RNA-dependent DNA polymerase)